MGHSYEAVDTVLSCEEGSYLPEGAFFANFTGGSDRYHKSSVYGGVDYDEASNWSYLDARYQTPVVDTGAGTMKIGFKAAGYNHLWIQTGKSYNEGFNLKYQPQSDHVIKLRLRFDGLQVLKGKENGYLRFYYFVGPDRFEGKGDKVERMYTMDAVTVSAEQICCGEFVTVCVPLSGLDSPEHTTITALRLQFGDMESLDSTKPGSIMMDYIYVGSDTAKIVSYLCTACGHTYTEDHVESLGHKEVVHPGVEPTCTEGGLSSWTDCSRCGKVLVQQQEVQPPLGHSYEILGQTSHCTASVIIPETAFFANFTGKSDRYSRASVYSGVDYDSASNWSNLTARYQPVTVDTDAGTLKTGFDATGYNHLWIQTGPNYDNGFDLNYRPKSDHVIQIRLRFDGMQVRDGKTNAYAGFYYFVGPDRYEGMGDKVERLYSMEPVKITPEQLSSGEFVTLTLPVSGLDSPDHTTITALRLQFGDLESTDASKPGSIVVDYIYIGPDSGKMVTYLCQTCGHTYTEDHVDAPGHENVYHEGVAPTCTEGGLSSWTECKRCGLILVPQEELPPLGHDYKTLEATPNCTEGVRIPEEAFFTNFTGASDRYSKHSTYSGVDYDSASNWSFLDARYQAVTVDTAGGTLQTGFKAAGYNHLWIQTGSNYNSGFNLNYQPKSDHIIKIRIRFDGMQVMNGKTNAYARLYYFVGPDRYEGMGDKVERLYIMNSLPITPEQLSGGDFVTLSISVGGLESPDHTTVTALRFQIGDLESTDASEPGTVTVDYFYMGPEKSSPVTFVCSGCNDHYTPDEVAPKDHVFVDGFCPCGEAESRSL